jgi:hypothetical protein
MKTKTTPVVSSSNANTTVTTKRRSAPSTSILRQQAWNYLELSREYEQALSKAWTPEMTLALATSLEGFGKAFDESVRVRDSRRASRLSLQKQVASSLAFRGELSAALRMFETRSPGSVGLAHLTVGRTKQGAVRLADWFAGVKSTVANHKAELTRLLGLDPVQKLEEQEAALRKAQARQLGVNRALREQTKHLAEARGQLLAAMDGLYVAAGFVFSQRKEVLQKFRKGIARRPKAVKAGAAVVAEVQAGVQPKVDAQGAARAA